MATTHRIIVLTLAIVLVLGGGIAVGAYVLAHQPPANRGVGVDSAQQSDERESDQIDVRVKAVHPKRDPSLVLSVRQLLSVEPYFQADLRSQVAGVVRYVPKAIHDPVRRGDVLIVLDTPDLEHDVAEKEAAILQRRQDVLVARATADNAHAAVDVAREVIGLRQAEQGQAGATRDYRKQRYDRFTMLQQGGGVMKSVVEEEERDYRSAEFAYQGAVAAVRKANADLREKESLQRTAEADIELKQSLVEVARKNRDKARAMLDYAKITAPFDGVLVRRNVSVGTFVQNASTGASEPLLRVDRTDIVTVVMKVPDNAAPFVAPDTEAVLQIDELPGVEIRGKVTRFSPAIQNQDRTMRVEVDLYNDEPQKYGPFVARALGSRLAGLAGDSALGVSALLVGGRDVWNHELKSDRDPLPTLPLVGGRHTTPRLIPGMSGYMRLNLQHFSDAYLIPSSAVFTRGGKPYLMAVKDGATELVPVHVQYNDGKVAKVAVIEQEAVPTHGQDEVLAELTGDEVIILNRQSELSEGEAVKVTLEKW